MNVQGFQKLTLLDFPGHTACTVFTGGCNLRCPFCHNASLVKKPTENPNAADEVLGYLLKRKGLIDGVCITGGEPLLQPDLKEFILKIKEMGFKVKLDTNGALPKRLKEILPLVDYVAMDVKSSLNTYPLLTGSEIDPLTFKESIDTIRNGNVLYEFRTTAVKGLHTKEDFIEIARMLEGEERYFIQKFTDSGNLIEGGSAFSREEMLDILKEVQKYIPRASLRGEE
jgi:pyruvate formate lyase activating enzyme